MRITKRGQLPKCVRQFKQLKGIHIGKCIDKICDFDDGHVAHAHSHIGDKYRGWICLRYKYQLKERLTLLHEVAHLIANWCRLIPPHGKKWKEALLDIGGTFKAFRYTHNGITRENIDYTHRSTKH